MLFISSVSKPTGKILSFLSVLLHLKEIDCILCKNQSIHRDTRHFMAGFSFLSRFALICNLFFAGAMVVRIFFHIDDAQQLGMIANIAVVMGMVLSPIVNMSVNLWYLILLLSRKQVTVPSWVRLFNVFILLAQIFFYIILPA